VTGVAGRLVTDFDETRFEILARNDLGERGPFTSAAVSDSRLFIKGRNYHWCVGAR
jgi:hypothetical protein